MVTLLATYSTDSSNLVRSEVFMAVNMKSLIFWDVILCSLEENSFTMKLETAGPWHIIYQATRCHIHIHYLLFYV